MPHIWASFCRRDGQPDFLAASSNSVNEASDGILELLGTQTATLTLQNAQVPGNGISSLGAAYSGDIHYMASNSGVTNIQTSAAATTVQLTSRQLRSPPETK